MPKGHSTPTSWICRRKKCRSFHACCRCGCLAKRICSAECKRESPGLADRLASRCERHPECVRYRRAKCLHLTRQCECHRFSNVALASRFPLALRDGRNYLRPYQHV